MNRLFLSVLSGLLLLVLSEAVDAQNKNGPVGIFESQDQYYEFMGSVKDAAYGEGGSEELRAMVPLLNDIALNKPVGWTASEYGTESSTLGMLSDADVRSELEMMDDQYERLQQLNAAVQKRSAEQIRQLDFSDRANLVSQINAIRRQAVDELNGVLLPHQIERLQQLRMQSQLRRKSLVDMLTSDPIKSKLKISDDQSSDLRKREKEIEEELQREITKLRERAREKLLSSLRPSQKAEIENLFGETYEFKNEKPVTRKKSRATSKK